MEFLLICTFLLTAFNAFVSGMVFKRLYLDRAEKKQEKACEKAMDDESIREEERISRKMSEGLENVMSYSVKLGRGKTTGGEP